MDELVYLMQNMQGTLGIQGMATAALKQAGRQAMQKFSLSGETMTPDEFVVMLGNQPWQKMLPKAPLPAPLNPNPAS